MSFLEPFLASLSSGVMTVLGIVTALAGLVLLAGLLAGQARKGIVQELRESLKTAKDEMDISRGRADRLEDESKRDHDALAAMDIRLSTLEAENRILRETLQTGIRLAPEFQQLIVNQQTHVDEIARDLADKVVSTAASLASKVDGVAKVLADKVASDAAAVAEKVTEAAEKVKQEGPLS